MWKENLYQPIEILLREHDDFPVGAHQHSFFEMAYIRSGSGHFSTPSQADCPYQAHDLFLIPPDQTHLFTIDTHSQYIFIRFTRNYVTDYMNPQTESCMELNEGFRLELQPTDRNTVEQLMDILYREIILSHTNTGQLLEYYVNCILLLCTRNRSEPVTVQNHDADDKARYMLQYIQQHIHQPQLLRLRLLAEKFQLSPTYAGHFFKRNFDEDFSRYVAENRLRRVEDMLRNTRMSIKEIAARMGYTDSCYLNRLFTRHYGMTPVQFRKRHTDPLQQFVRFPCPPKAHHKRENI